MNVLIRGDSQGIDHIQLLLQQEGPFFSLTQLARQTGIPLQTLSSAVQSGRMPALTMPDGRRYVKLEAALKLFAKSVDSSIGWQSKLLSAGLLSEIKPRSARQATLFAFDPIVIEGEPVSETAMRERR